MNIEEILSKIIVPFGVILTFISSLINIRFTRNNLKTSKYIDTITSERIKWLESIRIETSELCSELLILFQKAKRGILIRQDQELVLKASGAGNDKYVELDETYKKLKLEVHKDNLRIKLIGRIILLVLRLNPSEDTNIIEPLNHIRTVLECELYELSEVESCICEIYDIIEETQVILKTEWEKVKKETQKGKLIK